MLREGYSRHGRGEAALTVLLQEDAAIRSLNRAHKGRDRPTDVLAFEDGEIDPATGRPYLGDIAVSVDTARREARARGLRIRDEVALYALHGLLHLLGMRDDTDPNRAEMIRAQGRVFRKLGLTYRMEDAGA